MDMSKLAEHRFELDERGGVESIDQHIGSNNGVNRLREQRAHTPIGKESGAQSSIVEMKHDRIIGIGRLRIADRGGTISESWMVTAAGRGALASVTD